MVHGMSCKMTSTSTHTHTHTHTQAHTHTHTQGTSPARMAPSLGGDDMVVSDGEVVECVKHFLTYRNAVSAEEAGKGGFFLFCFSYLPQCCQC
jgi:hypothetical protein